MLASLTLTLLVLTSSGGEADEAPDPSAAPEKRTPLVFPEDVAPPEQPPASGGKDATPAASRVVFEVAGGGVGLLAGLAVGGIPAALFAVSALPSRHPDSLYIALLGIPLALVPPVGVTWAGQAMGGRGHYLGALAGNLAGAAASYGLAMYFADHHGVRDLGLIALMIPPVLAGMVAGYELSALLVPRPGRSADALLLPTAWSSSQGHGVGVLLSSLF